MAFSDQMLEVGKQLEVLGHEPVYSGFIDRYVGMSDEEIQRRKLEDKFEHDASKEFWSRMDECDAILILNYDRKGIRNYIGGNAFLDLGYAHHLGIKKFLLNPIPDIDLYRTEIEAISPTVLHQDLSRIEA